MHIYTLVKPQNMKYTSPMHLLEQLGKKIAASRRARKMSRAELADRAGLSARFLAQVEAGRGNIAFSRLYDICVALGEPMASLVGALPDAQRSGQSRVLALVGLRGAGKTTIGKKAASRLKKNFVELDALIEDAAGLTLPNIFEVHGEEYYRVLEHNVLASFLDKKPSAVLATGGGLVTRPDTYDLLRRNCVTIWLKARPSDHWNRVLQQDPRPMRGDPNAMEQLQSLLYRREPLYALADYTLDTSELGLQRSVD